MKKPSKPTPDFPLFAHTSGQWAKKIKGKHHYFGKWSDPEAALERYLHEKDYLQLGRRPPSEGGHSVLEVCDRFISSKKVDCQMGELAERTLKDYIANCKLLIDIAGDRIVEHLMPDDYQMIRQKLAEGVGTTTLGNRIRQARVALRYLEEITGTPPRFGKAFREPSAKAKRRARAEAGDRTHTPDEIKAAMDKASPQMRAMILLGINCAFGNDDCSQLTWDKLDLQGGWHTFERPKTYIPRRARLWGRTVEAIRAVPNTGERLFRTKYGNPWASTAIGHEAQKLGLKFYNLRRTFRTVADSTLETMAIRLVMGHAAADRDMDSRYVQRIEDSRLELVAEYVEAWLFGDDSA